MSRDCVNCGLKLVDLLLGNSAIRPVSLGSPVPRGIFQGDSPPDCTYARALELIFALPLLDLENGDDSYLCTGCAGIMDSLFKLVGQLTGTGSQGQGPGPAAHWFGILGQRLNSLSMVETPNGSGSGNGSGEEDYDEVDIKPKLEFEIDGYFSNAAEAGLGDFEHDWETLHSQRPEPSLRDLKVLKEAALSRPCFIKIQRCDDGPVSMGGNSQPPPKEQKKRDKRPSAYQCPNCPKSFKFKSYLQRHTTQVHEKKPFMRLPRPSPRPQKKQFQCSQCIKTYKYRRTLTEHFQAIHEQYRPWICMKLSSKCGNPRFSKRQALLSHLMSSSHKLERDEAWNLIDKNPEGWKTDAPYLGSEDDKIYPLF